MSGTVPNGRRFRPDPIGRKPLFGLKIPSIAGKEADVSLQTP
jgi:hypothetical protein